MKSPHIIDMICEIAAFYLYHCWQQYIYVTLCLWNCCLLPLSQLTKIYMWHYICEIAAFYLYHSWQQYIYIYIYVTIFVKLPHIIFITADNNKQWFNDCVTQNQMKGWLAVSWMCYESNWDRHKSLMCTGTVLLRVTKRCLAA